jgi:prepilin-type N-terminal cleavage/methylation domain-containing protein
MKKGVTLIELLVVVSIIVLLATMSFNAAAQARVKARDAKRLADIKLIQTSLDLYAATEGKKGNYPYPVRLYGQELDPYLADVPKDPKTKQSYEYFAPACLISENKPNTTRIVAANVSQGRKLLGLTTVTANDCPQGSWLPYAIMTTLEAPRSTPTKSNQYVSLVPGDTSVIVSSVKQAIAPR